MLVGTLQVELYIPMAGSLKEKRFVLKSIKTRVRNKFNVSVAEVDYLDKWQRAVLGIAAVSNDKRFLEGVLQQILNLFENESGFTVVDQLIEIC